MPITIPNKITSELYGYNQINTTALEREIDQLVYALYGLTEEEIEIVENS